MERELFKKRYQEASEIRDFLFKERIQQSYKQFDTEIKLVVCMEELAELLQVLSKYYRQKADRLNLIEELSDSLFCGEILRQHYSISEDEIEKVFQSARRSVVPAQQLQDSEKESCIALYMKEVSEIVNDFSECFVEKFSKEQMVCVVGSLLVCIDSLCQFYGITEGELNKAFNAKAK